MNIAFVSAELSPWFKVGGLADVSAALPRALAALGHDLRVFVPLYDLATPQQLGATAVEAVQDVLVAIGGRRDTFHLYERRPSAEGEPHLYFVQCAPFFEREGAIYTWHDDEARRFLFFMRAVFESLQRIPFAADILHANDWSTALMPLLLRTHYAWDSLFHHARTVLTIHNLAYQGVFDARVLNDLDLGSGTTWVDGEDLAQGRLNFLKSGLQLSDRLTTVSPTYAREIQEPATGCGLDEILRGRREDLVGVLNGVDTEVWNPLRDPFLPARYDRSSLWRKVENKRALLGRAGLEVRELRPLFGLIARLVAQKGIDLLAEVLEAFLEEQDAALVVLGQGEARFEDFFRALELRWPGRVRFWSAFDEEFAHLLEAGCDFFLMPSTFEPCGLNQMYSQLYGTVPVVRRTGGLADTVAAYDPVRGEGTGIVFEGTEPPALRDALDQALALHANPEHLDRLRRNGMKQDWSWARRADQYVEVYEGLLADA